MAESLTLRGVIEQIWKPRIESSRRQASDLLKSEHEVHRAVGHMDLGEAKATQRCADELAATLTGMTCATCKWYRQRTGRNEPGPDCAEPLGMKMPSPSDFCSRHTPRADRDREE